MEDYSSLSTNTSLLIDFDTSAFYFLLLTFQNDNPGTFFLKLPCIKSRDLNERMRVGFRVYLYLFKTIHSLTTRN